MKVSKFQSPNQAPINAFTKKHPQPTAIKEITTAWGASQYTLLYSLSANLLIFPWNIEEKLKKKIKNEQLD